MKTIKETKYLLFNIEERAGKKTKKVHIINKNSQEEIATIEWYGAWRQYCFMPSLEFDTVWNNTCLTDVISIINQLMKEREINKPTGKIKIMETTEKLKLGDEIDLEMQNGTIERVTVSEITPHPEVSNSIYYTFSNGVVCRDIRLH